MATVVVTNYSGSDFSGWIRCAVDSPIPSDAGLSGSVVWVVGKPTGAETRTVDIRCSLGNGETLTVDLDDSEPIEWVAMPLPADPMAHFGGASTLDGVPLEWLSLEPDGAAWCAHLHGRSGPMLHVDLWVTWYPSQPGWCTGEALVTASNGSVPDIDATVDAGGLALAFGSAAVLVLGRGIGSLVQPGTRFADSQARGMPLVFVWAEHMQSNDDWKSAVAAINLGVAAVGIERVAPWGNPTQVVNGRRWATQNLPRALAVLHSWDSPTIGIVPTSTQTGAQEDQLFRGHEMLSFPGAVWPAYLAAAAWSHRPCHHLEASGLPIDPADHPRLVFWHSRPHWHASISPDQLGKPRSLAPWDVPGEWFGADREHWLVGRLCAAARATGSPMLQRLLEHQAVAFLLGETVQPGLSTSHTDAARSVGYAALVAIQLDAGLRDRALADRVRARARARVLSVYLPEIGESVGDVWDPRADDRILTDVNLHLPAGERFAKGVMWWQQSLGCYGLDLLGEHLGIPEARALALRAADAIVRHAWRKDATGRWICWENTGLAADAAPLGELREGRGAHRTGWFDGSWMVPGLAVILRHRPDDATARAIWAQVTAGGGSWVPPGVPQ